jgi:hypothetical protein
LHRPPNKQGTGALHAKERGDRTRDDDECAQDAKELRCACDRRDPQKGCSKRNTRSGNDVKSVGRLQRSSVLEEKRWSDYAKDANGDNGNP